MGAGQSCGATMLNPSPEKMEAPLNEAVDKLMQDESVTGVLCADQQGLCLSARGDAKAEAAGALSALGSHAQQLGAPDQGAAVVILDTNSSNILVTSTEDLLTAIFRKPAP